MKQMQMTLGGIGPAVGSAIILAGKLRLAAEALAKSDAFVINEVPRPKTPAR